MGGREMSNKAIAKGCGKGKPGNKGHFKLGKSGNPKGRPAKKLEPAKSFLEGVGEALAEKVSVPIGGGKKQKMALGHAMGKKLVHAMANAPFNQLLPAVEKLLKLGAFEHMLQVAEEENEDEPYLPEESRRLLRLTLKEIGEGDDDDFDAGHLGA